jgi:hypothetical protein
MLLATGEFVQCGYQSHMALFPLLKTARVASGENSLSSDALSVSNLLTGSMAYCLQSQSFSEEILADQQSSSRTLENQRAKLKHYSNTNRNESVTAQLLGYFSYKKVWVENLVALSF